MIGFETIGNATVIVHDDKPLLATDPWFEGSAYFGSWGLSHSVPAEQTDHIKACPYIFLTHGHPDHLNGPCLEQLREATLLLPNHAGARIADDLRASGFKTQVLDDAVWTVLSPRVKVMSLCDYNQDAVLLIDVDGHLLINLNDSSHEAFFWKRTVKRIVKAYEKSFLLKIASYGDANMINYHDENGIRIPPRIKDIQVGRKIRFYTEYYRPRYFVPFSSFHVYQRADSAWANEYTTPLEAYLDGWGEGGAEMLPAFIRWDCSTETFEELKPLTVQTEIFEPTVFGDNWSDVLEPEDKPKIEKYFNDIGALSSRLDYVTLRVGQQDFSVALDGVARSNRGVTFELPRHSLMTAVEHCLFDDLMIGNYAKTTLHGDWSLQTLYPHFMPLVPKYADNGLARTEDELAKYFATYRRRAPMRYLLHLLETGSQSRVRPWLREHPKLFDAALKAYQFTRRL